MRWTLTALCALLVAAADAADAAVGPRHSDDIERDARLEVPALVRQYGYPLEEHRVLTADGYVLTAHRIPHARGLAPAPRGARTPVLLMHGLLCSSADFLVLGPDAALGYLLADAGYDVWLANARGNHYSRRHLWLDPDDRERLDFWKFSWDEIGNRDLPALADHIGAVTGRRMHYVGYSQGSTAFLVLMALRPEYNERFLSFQALAPAAFAEYSEDPVRDRLVHLESVIDVSTAPAGARAAPSTVAALSYTRRPQTLAFRHGVGEVLGRHDAFTALGLRFCADGARLQPLCARLLGGGEAVNRTLLPVFLGHTPAGAGVRQILHYAQVQRFGRFARYNHDALGNLARYGSLRPPEYDVTRVAVPTYLHYGLSDKNSLAENVRLLARRMGPRAALLRVPRASFNHFDFIWAGDARAQLYEPLVATLRRHDPPRR
ncbi:lipase 1-like [Pararge aegeria]|uniref:lipase 1-like n=1 Tax=Pararge aegeria TaxID=116150 RepID=UPI0019CFEEAA|nr:lipase 1-like [Pararge aegeria]